MMRDSASPVLASSHFHARSIDQCPRGGELRRFGHGFTAPGAGVPLIFRRKRAALWLLFGAMTALVPFGRADDAAVPLPEGVTAVWDETKAYREATPTRERICLNGLWRWQPGETRRHSRRRGTGAIARVPGSWPGISDQPSSEGSPDRVCRIRPTGNQRRWGSIHAAWYQRTLTVPANWAGRRVSLDLACLNSYAAVFVDGQKAGEMQFPGGRGGSLRRRSARDRRKFFPCSSSPSLSKG